MAQGFRKTKPAFLDPLESEPVRTNFIAVASTNAGAVAPTDPVEGMLWLDTSDPVNLRVKAFINGTFITILNNIAGGPPSQSSVDIRIHDQVAPSSTWTATHNLGTQDLIVAIRDENDIAMLPNNWAPLDNNNIQINFLNPQAGTAVIMG